MRESYFFMLEDYKRAVHAFYKEQFYIYVIVG